MSAIGTALLLRFDWLQSLENYIKSVYYSNYPMNLYFQVQFLKLKCTENAKITIKNALKSDRKKKYHHWKKCKELNRDIETQSQDGSIQKVNIRKILNKKNNMKTIFQENPTPKKEYEKRKYQENNRTKCKIYNIKYIYII